MRCDVQPTFSESLAELDPVHRDPPGCLFPRVEPPSGFLWIKHPVFYLSMIAAFA